MNLARLLPVPTWCQLWNEPQFFLMDFDKLLQWASKCLNTTITLQSSAYINCWQRRNLSHAAYLCEQTQQFVLRPYLISPSKSDLCDFVFYLILTYKLVCFQNFSLNSLKMVLKKEMKGLLLWPIAKKGTEFTDPSWRDSEWGTVMWNLGVLS